MKKFLLLMFSSALVLTSFQSQATTPTEYVVFRGGYAAMKHKSKSSSSHTPETEKFHWNDSVFSGGMGYGWRLNNFRVEAEVNTNSAADKRRNFLNPLNPLIVDGTTVSKIKTHSLMFNTYYDLPTGLPLRPYLGAGAGLAHVKAQFKSRSDGYADKFKMSDNHFAWQVGGGFAYELTPEWTLDIGYRFFDYGDIVKKIYEPQPDGSFITDKLRLTSKAHNAYLALRYYF